MIRPAKRFVTLAAVGISCVWGCAPSWAISGSVHEIEQPSGVHGLVVPANTGTEVKNAPALQSVTVTCEGCAHRSRVVTGMDGSFAFDLGLQGEEPKPVVLRFEKKGYQTIEVTVAATQPRSQMLNDSLLIVLEPGGPQDEF